MPNYEYICKCGLVFEVSRPMKESARKGKCPKCETMADRKFSPLETIIN